MKQQFVHEELFSKRCFDMRDLLVLLDMRRRKTGVWYCVHREDAAWFYVRAGDSRAGA